MRGRFATLITAAMLVSAAPAAADWSPPHRVGDVGLQSMLVFDAKGDGIAAWAPVHGKRVAPLTGSGRAANPALNTSPGTTGGFGSRRLLTLEQTTTCGNCNPPGNQLYLRAQSSEFLRAPDTTLRVK